MNEVIELTVLIFYNGFFFILAARLFYGYAKTKSFVLSYRGLSKFT